MAIRKKLVAGFIKASTSTHTKNLDPVTEVKPDTLLENQDDDFKLFDPDALEGGSTHTKNLQAAVDDNLPNDSSNVSTIDNDIDPAEGYMNQDSLEVVNAPQSTLITAEDEESEDDTEDSEDEVVEADADDFDEESEEDDWDDEPHPEDFDLDEPSEDTEGEEDIEAEAELPVGSSDDEMAVVDVDEVDDNDTDDMVFASIGSKVLVIKASRVIASMTKKQAIRAAAEDIYQSEPFHEASYQEAKRHGLRAGLKSMGFSLATVNVASASVINKRVDARVKAVTAAVHRTSDAKNKCFAQSLAIASVGTARRFFKDANNDLQNTLIANLQRAGVRDASKIVNAAFAQHGVGYAKSIMTIAQKLSDMPDEHRSQFADALDMLDDEGEFIESDVVFEDDDISDFVDAEVDDLEDDFVPESITAALASPGHVSRGALLQKNKSLTASALLQSDTPLQFSI